MPVAARRHWSGIEPPRDGRVVEATFRWSQPADPPTDYDRACDVNDYVGILEIASYPAIVLNVDPLPATWVPLPEGGILIARLYTSEIGYPSRLPPIEGVEWTVSGSIESNGSPFILFDSTEAGWEEPVFPSLDVTLGVGRYEVEHGRFVNSQMELWLVRLRPV
jgi:hypothetical protein